MQYSIIVCGLVSLSLFMTVQCAEFVTRQTVNGPVQGFVLTNLLGNEYHAFPSIPYAKPPITGRDPQTGEMVDRRFKAPEMLDRNWTEPLKFDGIDKKCIQGKDYLSYMSEDCLTLGVFAPAGGAKRKTVLVFIHGGSFSYGGGMKGCDFLVSQDNIVVTIQYRLGIFGFLNLNYGEYTGNMGLKDQQLALKWVYENIEYFSGNKDEILLMGQSAGAASTHFHMLNEQSRKYFTRTFLISSSAFSPYALRKADHVYQIQNCSQFQDMNKLVEYIKTADAAILRECYLYHFPGKLNPVWVPTIESPHNEKAFMTKTPEEIYSLGMAPAMDVMFSFATQEMLAFFPELLSIDEPLLKEDWTQFNEDFFELPFEGVTRHSHPNVYKFAVEKLRAAYYSKRTTVEAIRTSNSALVSDLVLTDSILKAVVLQTEVGFNSSEGSQEKNIFLFRFSVNTELKTYVPYQAYVGATHADDLPYIFQLVTPETVNIYTTSIFLEDEIYDKSMQMSKIITNFARKGDPSIDGDTPFQGCQSPHMIYCQEVGNEPTTHVINGIKEILHYFVWRDIEKTLRDSTGNKASRPSQGFLLYFFITTCICVYIFPNVRYYI